MNFSALFIRRPVGTTLLAAAIVLAGAIAFGLLPVAPLPQVDFPTISVQASLPGASPDVMAATVATPLERALGRIAGISEMTSSSSLGSTRVTIQFDLSKDINNAAREVQAALNAARPLLPSARSSGVATVAAIVSGLAPGSEAETEMVGKSTCGRGETGSSRNATSPASAMPSVSSVVATGRSMKGLEMFMAGPAWAPGPQPTSRPDPRRDCQSASSCAAPCGRRPDRSPAW